MQQEDLDELYNDIYGDEESEVEEEYEEHDVIDIEDDKEYMEKVKEEFFYKGFSTLEDIYGEKIKEDYIPDGYTPKQKALFSLGVKKIKQINEKYGCSLSFNEFVNNLDKQYEFCSKKELKKLTITDAMSNTLWKEACYYSKKMEEKSAYATFSTKKIAGNLKRNFDVISNVLGLYVQIHPEKFPIEERENNVIFNSSGKLRSTFKIQDDAMKIDFNEEAEYLREKAVKTSKTYYGQFSGPEESKAFIVNKINSIINDKKAISTQGDRVQRLAQCVRFLRPLQARRDQRNILQYFTNHKIYVAERDTLRQCKEEMKRLGLDRKEISKVLHGGAFNDVKFNDGMTVREKQQNPDVKDLVYLNEESNQINEVEKEVNVNRVALVVDEVNEISDVLDNQLEEKSIEKNIDKSLV